MSNVIIPAVPATATADERRRIMWDALSNLDMSDKVEKRNDLTYLSWANAISEFRKAYPSAEYHIVKNPNTGLPYFVDPAIGIICFVEIEVDGVKSEAWLPVMSSANKALKLESYTYQAWDSYKKQYVEKTVPAATMTDINKTLMRTLTKAIALSTGIGMYIFQGEDFPEKASENNGSSATPQSQKNTQHPASQPQSQMQIQQPQTTASIDPLAGIKNAINGASDVTALMSLYLDHQGEIEANPNIKQLLTNRKIQLQAA
ncbi:MAG: DUF1071 domain-containing protein [Prevotella sp.]|nr:DUF1071 domain-containing protein [Candidatus Prevotella equi]